MSSAAVDVCEETRAGTAVEEQKKGGGARKQPLLGACTPKSGIYKGGASVRPKIFVCVMHDVAYRRHFSHHGVL